MTSCSVSKKQETFEHFDKTTLCCWISVIVQASFNSRREFVEGEKAEMRTREGVGVTRSPPEGERMRDAREAMGSGKGVGQKGICNREVEGCRVLSGVGWGQVGCGECSREGHATWSSVEEGRVGWESGWGRRGRGMQRGGKGERGSGRGKGEGVSKDQR